MQKKNCIQCGKDFTISDEEIAFFQQKNLSIPKRCRACRKENKRNKQNKTESVSMNQATTNQTNHSNKPKFKNKWSKWLIACLLVLLGGFGITVPWLDDEPSNQSGSDSVLDANQTGQSLSFREEQFAIEHFQKHGDEFDYQTVEQYINGANRVISSPKALHKLEQEDGDDLYYLEATNEFVVVSTDGYIRTYFKPEDGVAYYHRK